MRIERFVQPVHGQAGNRLNTMLSEAGTGSRFVMISAWAKASGISRLWDAIAAFRASGGNVVGIVGIDLHGTSREALELLIKACDRAYVVHDAAVERSFHVKAYWIEDTQGAQILTGSGNLTVGGLFTNYEIFDHIWLDYARDDRVLLAQAETHLSDILADVDTAKHLTPQLLSKLVTNSLVRDERYTPNETSRGKAARARLFGTRQGLPGAPPPSTSAPSHRGPRGSRSGRVTRARPTRGSAGSGRGGGSDLVFRYENTPD